MAGAVHLVNYFGLPRPNGNCPPSSSEPRPRRALGSRAALNGATTGEELPRARSMIHLGTPTLAHFATRSARPPFAAPASRARRPSSAPITNARAIAQGIAKPAAACGYGPERKGIHIIPYQSRTELSPIQGATYPTSAVPWPDLALTRICLRDSHPRCFPARQAPKCNWERPGDTMPRMYLHKLVMLAALPSRGQHGPVFFCTPPPAAAKESQQRLLRRPAVFAPRALIWAGSPGGRRCA